jgi:PTS system beta-glucosides-specific IIC component
LGIKDYQMAGMGVFGYTMFLNPREPGMKPMLVGIVVSIVCILAGMVLELLFYRDAPAKETAAGESAEANKGSAGSRQTWEEVGNSDCMGIAAPMTGRLLPLSKVPDAAFSSGALGQGAAIEPTEGRVYAPIDGEISTFFPTGHAVGITGTDGVEILIHVGMDTVELGGRGFIPKKKQGDKVQKGQLLLEFDLERLKEAGYRTETPIVVTNSDDYEAVQPVDLQEITRGQVMLTLIKKPHAPKSEQPE